MSEKTAARPLVLAATLAAFAPALLAGFAAWDDPAYVVSNPLLAAPDPRAIATSVLGGVWIPLTWLSLAADRALWGLDAGGYHLTNILLHAATALLLLEVLRLVFSRLGLRDAQKAALFGALFWAVHPLRVESVAWISERKGVLSGLLWTAALLARLRGHDSRRLLRWEAACLACFALSLAAKPNGLTFPLVLLALERGLLRRRETLLSYAPHLVLSAAAFGVTLWAGAQEGVLHGTRAPGPLWTLGQVLYGLTFLPLRTLWPSGLSVYHPPRAWFGSWSWPLFAHGALLAAALAALRASWPRSRPVAAALAASFLALLPMLGLVQHGVAHSAAERFTYLAAMPLAGLFGVALARGRAAVLVAAAWIALLGAASWRACSAWRTPLSLWSAAAASEPCAYTLANHGAVLAREGRHEEALGPLRASLALSEEESLPHETLGTALLALGRKDEALTAWRRGLAVAPSPRLKAFLGAALGSGPEAARLLEEAVAAEPGNASWRVDLAAAYAVRGRASDARRQLEAALDAAPRDGRALNDLGLLESSAGRPASAEALFRRALTDPAARSRANHNLGNLAMAAGRAGEAEERFREAVRLEPDLGAARVNLGNLLVRRGRLREAAAQYRAVKKEDRASFEARSNLSRVEAYLSRTR